MSREIFVFDVGSTFTKLNLFCQEKDGTLRWIARTQAPTTVNDIMEGIAGAVAELSEAYRASSLTGKTVLASSSAAGGLRMVAIGYMPRVTAKAAKEVAMSAGARVLEVLSAEDPLEHRRQVLKEIRPDIILLTGGTDGGDEESLLENAEMLAEMGLPAVVILAGNASAQGKAEAILTAANVKCRRVANVMPNIHELKVKPAREAIHQEFIRQITRAPGLRQLESLVTNGRVIPTPGAVLMGAELLARGYYGDKGIGSLVVVDLGGATTDVHSVIPELEELTLEQRGLILTNEKQVSYRTVEGNLGLRVSCGGILESAGPHTILRYADLPVDDKNQEELNSYVKKVEVDTSHLAGNEKEKAFDRGLAVAAVEMALKRHAGFISQEYDPVLGLAPGTPQGRDLRRVKHVVAVGGIFTVLPLEEARGILEEALARPGISLLPRQPRILIDRSYLLYAIGVLSQLYPYQALRFAKDYFDLNEEEKGNAAYY
ncbi:MAG: glutamate mutase L [Moorellaceae bacterium]